MSRFFNYLICTAIVSLLPSTVLAQQHGPGYGGHMMNGGWHGWFVGPIIMIVFISVAVVVVVLLLRWLGVLSHGSPPHQPPTKTPIDILKERLARGEIDKEEFEERRRILDQ
jgi:putative membrane protein